MSVGEEIAGALSERLDAEGTPGGRKHARSAGPQTESAAGACQNYIAELARRKIRGFIGTIDENGTYLSNVYAGSASLAESITADYHGRFLIELLQNAHDVHPEERGDGRIEVLLDLGTGEFGTLYVANMGNPFSTKNVDALCDMGLSSKPPGEAIGNKGLGFRSVHHISDRPLIYSQTPGASLGSPRFNGYCFGFADSSDLDQLITEPGIRELAGHDLPLFHVPVALEVQPPVVLDYAARGFATVIALPIRDGEARKDTLAEVSALADQSVPLLLFLERLSLLKLSVRQPDGSEEPIPLPRDPTLIEVKGFKAWRVDLGTAGIFLMARRAIPEREMKRAIGKGVSSRQLHKHWSKWEGDGDVAVAVRLDGGPISPRLYTYLPMGPEAEAPFSGYLHGSFFPTSNRKGLDAEIALNALVLERATRLAGDVVVWLASSARASSLDAPGRAQAGADLLSWRTVTSLGKGGVDLPQGIATSVAAAAGVETLELAPVIPCFGAETGAKALIWKAPQTARRWSHASETFSPDALALSDQAPVSPIWSGLDDRLDRLAVFLKEYCPGWVEHPTAPERVEVACIIAANLALAGRRSMPLWAGYYRDLAVLLEKDGRSLAGKPVLMCEDEELRPAMGSASEPGGAKPRGPKGRTRQREEVSVFMPPALRGGEAEDFHKMSTPAELKDRFAFMPQELDWFGELQPARQFLEAAGLVSPFEREPLLNQLSRVMRDDERNATRAAGLRWAYQIWLQPRLANRPFKLQPAHRFFVPTKSGQFIEAREAVFSGTWPNEMHGRLVERFLEQAPASADLSRLGDRLLASKDHYVFKAADQSPWAEFLRELGVQRGLMPIAMKAPAQRAERLRTFSFCADLGISVGGANAWKLAVEKHLPEATSLPSGTTYVFSGDLWWLPGQGDVDQFSVECRETYALLILAWMAQADTPPQTVTVHHTFYVNADRRQWLTPLAAFLRYSTWIPCETPSAGGSQQVNISPADLWLPAENTPDRFPAYLRRPVFRVGRALEVATPRQLEALHDVGARTFDNVDTLLDQCRYLSSQFGDAGFDRWFETRFINFYHRTWSRIADQYAAGHLALDVSHAPDELVVRRSGDVAVATIEAEHAALGAEAVYIRDTDDDTAASLVSALGKAVFDARVASPDRMGGLFKALFGSRVRYLSETSYEIIADGRGVEEGASVSLVAACPRIRLLAALTMESLRGTDAQRLPADRALVLDRFDRLQFQTVGSVMFKIDGQDVGASHDEAQAFSVNLADGAPCIIVREAGEVTWRTMDAAMGAICAAVELPMLEAPMRLLAITLAGQQASVDAASDSETELDDLASVLRLDASGRRLVRDTLGSSLDRFLMWIRAVVHLGGGMDAVDRLDVDQAEAVKDVGRMKSIVAPALVPLGLDPDTLLDACRNSLSVGDLRERLDLDFASLNASLLATGQKPDTYPEHHAASLANFINEREVEIIEKLRRAYARDLAQGKPQPDYVAGREALRHLTPNPAWLMLFREPPADEMTRLVEDWLTGRGTPLAEKDDGDLEPLGDVRAHNAAELKRFDSAAQPLVTAWSRKAGVSIPQLWSEAAGSLGLLRALLDNAGVFDFQRLAPADLLVWVDRLGAWASGMPLSIDLGALGLVQADLDQERLAAQKLADDRRREARSVYFNGRQVDPDQVDWDALSAELSAGLNKSMLGMSLGAMARLAPVTPRASRERDPSGKKTTGMTHPPSQKTDLIGRLGELAVYHWLKARYPLQNIDAAWVSRNGEPFTGRDGSDSLGFDFEMTYQKQRFQIEVKASLADSMSFEMGETEVHAARIAARARSGLKYVIAYVSHVGVPASTRVEILPNPLSEEGEGVLALQGEGLRYRFRRSAPV